MLITIKGKGNGIKGKVYRSPCGGSFLEFSIQELRQDSEFTSSLGYKKGRDVMFIICSIKLHARTVA